MTSTPLTRRSLLAGAAGLTTAAAVATAGLGATPAAAAEAAASALYPLKPPHLLEAETLVEYLRLRSDQWPLHNRYDVPGQNLGTTAVTWGRPGHPEEFGNLSQCASFITSVLERAYGSDTAYAWATGDYFDQYFPSKSGSTRTAPFPEAEDLQAGFANAANVPHFDPVTKPVNLRPGDLVAIDYDAVRTSTPYTGHVVMIRAVEGTFASSVDSQVGSGVVPYLFQIVDCTSNPHGDPDITSRTSTDHYRAYPDTRGLLADDNSAYTQSTGVGYGHMVFYADPVTKLFAGYRWSVNDSSPVTATGSAATGAVVSAARVNAFLV
ncbi:hypothetical protein ACEZDB_21470 [Streptacidiphilus sp. N1-3]|uniref:CHAP domain-containing protein n=1 Tax=Streptacidiphilus alkalitolerans TaxID=3342712 RepID=A0ABV6X4J2_9ACTN